MFTESWPLDYDPLLPPRWTPDAGKRPVVVYLDQWCFDHLAHDRAGRPVDQAEKGSYEFLRGLALSGKVVFPLSQAHYRENWNRQNADARWDTAVAMAELSGFHTLRVSDLPAWDALQAVNTFAKAGASVEVPEPLGWGFQHCLTGTEGSATIVDKRTGQRVRLDSFSDGLRDSVATLSTNVAYRVELAVLALRDPRLEHGGLLPFTPIPDERGARFIAEEARIRQAVDNHGRSLKVARNSVEFLSYRDSGKHLARALRALSLPSGFLDEAIARSLTTDGQAPAMHGLLTAMPIQGTFAELRVQTHVRQWKAQPSDFLDFWTLATVLPFADYFLADKKTHNLAADAKLNNKSGGRVIRKLRDLCDLLQQKTGSS